MLRWRLLSRMGAQKLGVTEVISVFGLLVGVHVYADFESLLAVISRA